MTDKIYTEIQVGGLPVAETLQQLLHRIAELEAQLATCPTRKPSGRRQKDVDPDGHGS